MMKAWSSIQFNSSNCINKFKSQLTINLRLRHLDSMFQGLN